MERPWQPAFLPDGAIMRGFETPCYYWAAYRCVGLKSWLLKQGLISQQ